MDLVLFFSSSPHHHRNITLCGFDGSSLTCDCRIRLMNTSNDLYQSPVRSSVQTPHSSCGHQSQLTNERTLASR